MKKIVGLIATISLALLFSIQTQAQNFSIPQNWQITSFDAIIKVNSDSTLNVEETILADFTQEQHHGIIREIPIRYEGEFGSAYILKIKLLSVSDEHGKPWQVETTKTSDFISFRIGDPNMYRKEPTTFILNYRVERSIRYFENHDELYWNVTSSENDVPIKNASANVVYPENYTGEEYTPKDEDIVCYTGFFGATEQDCSIDRQTDRVIVKTKSPLPPGNGLTLGIKFPKGLIYQPTATENILLILRDNWIIGVPIFVFILLFIIWHKTGRDPEINQTVIPRFEIPKDLTPAEAGTIMDESVDIRDITATVIDLAVRGYIIINEVEEKGWLGAKTNHEFALAKQFANDQSLKPHEIAMLQGIFQGREKILLSDLKQKFYVNLPQIKNGIYESMGKNGLFVRNPEFIRKVYTGVGGTIAFLGFVLVPVFFHGEIGIISIIVAGAIIIIFGRFMPRKTRKGKEAYLHIRGLEEYIKTAEVDRLKFQEDEKILIEKVLPYAMALNLVDKWTHTFAPLLQKPPNWYHSSNQAFSMNLFASNLNRLGSSMAQTMTSSPRSAGTSGFGKSGFSGGGFGGGSTRAW